MYVHRNPDKAATIEQWQHAAFYHDLHAQFYLIAHEFLRAVSAMANAVRAILSEQF